MTTTETPAAALARLRDRVLALPTRGRQMRFVHVNDAHDWYEAELTAALDAYDKALRAANARPRGGSVATSGNYG